MSNLCESRGHREAQEQGDGAVLDQVQITFQYCALTHGYFLYLLVPAGTLCSIQTPLVIS
jgi:hypothetical protein